MPENENKCCSPVHNKSCLSFLFDFFHPLHSFNCKNQKLTLQYKSHKTAYEKQLLKRIHGHITCLFPEIPVIFNRCISAFLKFKCVVLKNNVFLDEQNKIIMPLQIYSSSSHHCQFLSWCLSKCFGPSCFSWVSLLLEVFDTFGSAESERLHLKRNRYTCKNL